MDVPASSVFYGLAIALNTGFGMVYLTKPRFMPYHQAAVETDWDLLPKGVRILILALMRVAASAMLAWSLMAGSALVMGLHLQSHWMAWLMPASGAIISLGSLYAMLSVARNTPGRPPLWTFPVGMGLLLVGLATSQMPH